MKTIRVVAAVIKEGNKIFATARGYGDYKGWWEFPGGKIEQGETAKEALVREIQEELSIKVEVGDFITAVEYKYPSFYLKMDCYWCAITDGEPVLLEHEDCRWLSLDQLGQVKWLPADELVIKKIEEAIR